MRGQNCLQFWRVSWGKALNLRLKPRCALLPLRDKSFAIQRKRVAEGRRPLQNRKKCYLTLCRFLTQQEGVKTSFRRSLCGRTGYVLAFPWFGFVGVDVHGNPEPKAIFFADERRFSAVATHLLRNILPVHRSPKNFRNHFARCIRFLYFSWYRLQKL